MTDGLRWTFGNECGGNLPHWFQIQVVVSSVRFSDQLSVVAIRWTGPVCRFPSLSISDTCSTDIECQTDPLESNMNNKDVLIITSFVIMNTS